MTKCSGFSLMELIIAVAVVGILATAAYPSYQDYVVRSRRTDAMGELQQAATAMERYFTATGSYTGATVGTGPGATITNRLPRTGAQYYTVGLSNLTATTFTITATPQSGTSQANDGAIDIDQSGLKRWDKGGDGTWSSDDNDWQ